MVKIEAWVRAFRLRTLPLSFSSIILGSFLALETGNFSGAILAGALVTTLFLQILSNLANDYGDFANGVDNAFRIGPERVVQSGDISAGQMRTGIAVCATLSLISGIWLLVEASRQLNIGVTFVFFLIGLLAIAAAIKYTVGKKPYGYQGFGDIAVFLFFGIVGVSGTYYLHTNRLDWVNVLPAVSVGLLATGVLNLNNMRDLENDRNSGKRSLVVMLGMPKARIYHTFLLSTALLCAILSTALRFHSAYQWLYLITVPLLYQNVRMVWVTRQPSELDGELKKLAIATLLFSLTMGLGLIY